MLGVKEFTGSPATCNARARHAASVQWRDDGGCCPRAAMRRHPTGRGLSGHLRQWNRRSGRDCDPRRRVRPRAPRRGARSLAGQRGTCLLRANLGHRDPLCEATARPTACTHERQQLYRGLRQRLARAGGALRGAASTSCPAVLHPAVLQGNSVRPMRRQRQRRTCVPAWLLPRQLHRVN